MNDFRRVLVACAAVSTFAAGAYTVLSGASSVVTDRIQAVMAQREALVEQSVVEDLSDAASKVLKKALK